MSGARGFVAGLLGLTLLEVVVTSAPAAGRVGTAVDLVAGVLSRWLNPTMPLVPDLTSKKAATVASSSTSTPGSAYVTAPPSSTPGGKARKTVPTPQPALNT